MITRKIKATIATFLLTPVFVWIAPENNDLLAAKAICSILLIGILWIVMYLMFSSDKDDVNRSNKMEI